MISSLRKFTRVSDRAENFTWVKPFKQKIEKFKSETHFFIKDPVKGQITAEKKSKNYQFHWLDANMTGVTAVLCQMTFVECPN